MIILSKWISILSRYSQMHYEKHFVPLGLSGGQFIFVLYICDHPGVNQDDLARNLSFNKSTVARVIAALVQNGLIDRRVNGQDKRIYNLYPTRQAEKIVPLVMEATGGWNASLTNGFSPQEVLELERLLKKAAANAKQYAKHQKEDENQ